MTANRRVSRLLRVHFDQDRRQAGARVWEAPDILPYDAWVARLWRELAARDPIRTPLLLNSVQEDLLWRRAIAASPYADQLLDVGSTAAMAARAWELMHAWELTPAEYSFQETADSQAFFDWRRLLDAELRARIWITRSELPAQLMERGVRVQGPVTCAGFVETTPRDAGFLRWAGAVERSDATRKAITPVVRKLRDRNDELTQAALWARQKMTSANGPARIAVMLPELAGIAQSVERIFDDVLAPTLAFAHQEPRLFQISSGVPSNEVPLISTALLLLGLRNGLNLSEAGLLLRSPFLHFDRVRAAELDARLRRKRSSRVSFQDFESLLPGLFHQAQRMFEGGDRPQFPSQWSADFSKLVSSAGWAQRSPHAIEQQAIEHWQTLLSDLASLDLVVDQPVTYEQALSQLRRIARRSVFHANSQDHDAEAPVQIPVQIMDLREGAVTLVDYDAIWVAGLHAGAWPEAVRPNPFIPLSLQRAAGIAQSSPEFSLERARKATERLKQSATDVVFSFPASEGEQELRPSPLLPHAGAVNESVSPDTALRRLYASAPVLDQLHPGRKSAAASAGKLSHGGAHLLADQAACPFKAFAVHRLGARELDAPEVGVSPRERGNAVHVALEQLWQKLGSHAALLRLSPVELSTLIHECAEAAIHAKSEAPERFRRLELNRLEQLLAKWMEQESGRRPFSIEQSELNQEVSLGSLLLKIRPDRIDRYHHDDSLAILDYKTGKQLSLDDWDGPRPAAPQLPLYAVNAASSGHKVDSVMYVQLIATGPKMHQREGRELDDSLPRWQTVLQQLAADFVAGPAQVDPKNGKKTCNWCRLQSLCRVDELGVLSAAGGEDGDGGDSQ